MVVPVIDKETIALVDDHFNNGDSVKIFDEFLSILRTDNPLLYILLSTMLNSEDAQKRSQGAGMMTMYYYMWIQTARELNGQSDPLKKLLKK